jgi:predicted kinase
VEAAPHNAGAYAIASRQHVYEELLKRTMRALKARESLILDGTFLSAELLRRAADLAEGAQARLLVIRCHCPDEEARRRIAARVAAGPTLSDARSELYDLQRAELEAVPADISSIAIDTTLDLAKQVEHVRSAMSAITPHPRR